jgi:hypothetical protein
MLMVQMHGQVRVFPLELQAVSEEPTHAAGESHPQAWVRDEASSNTAEAPSTQTMLRWRQERSSSQGWGAGAEVASGNQGGLWLHRICQGAPLNHPNWYTPLYLVHAPCAQAWNQYWSKSKIKPCSNICYYSVVMTVTKRTAPCKGVCKVPLIKSFAVVADAGGSTSKESKVCAQRAKSCRRMIWVPLKPCPTIT